MPRPTSSIKEYTFPADELNLLRGLAKKMKELSKLPVMAERRMLWQGINDGIPGTRPPFALESWTFDRDFMPESIFQCKSEFGRKWEKYFLRHIRHQEILGDDHVCPGTIDMFWHVWIDEFGMEIPTEYVKDAEGYVTGYHFDCPIKDLETDGYGMIKPSEFGVDREETMAEKKCLEDSFGDILPVVIRSGTYGFNCLTQRLMRLMPQDAFFMAMCNCPDKLMELLGLLRDNAKNVSLWAEREGLLVLNNENQCTCGTCYNFTTQLPKQPVQPGRVKLKDMWGVMDSQETVGVSPAMFESIIFPFYAELAELFGLLYWGCCEPVDPIWESCLSKLPNLKALSISRWANQEFMADALMGKGIVYSRKPNPNLLGVDVVLNEEAWAAEIRGTLELTVKRGIPVEFVVRDVYTMHRNLDKARRAVEIARREIDRFYK